MSRLNSITSGSGAWFGIVRSQKTGPGEAPSRLNISNRMAVPQRLGRDNRTRDRAGSTAAALACLGAIQEQHPQFVQRAFEGFRLVICQIPFGLGFQDTQHVDEVPGQRQPDFRLSLRIRDQSQSQQGLAAKQLNQNVESCGGISGSSAMICLVRGVLDRDVTRCVVASTAATTYMVITSSDSHTRRRSC